MSSFLGVSGSNRISGTGTAAAHATACAALLIQANEATTPTQIESRLATSSVTVTDRVFPQLDCSPICPDARFRCTLLVFLV